MKRLLLLISCLCLLRPCVRAAPVVEPWSDEDRKLLKSGALVPGDALLVNEPLVTEPGPTDLTPPTAEDLTEKNDAPDLVPERYLDAYFKEKPKSFLVDPQGLLDEKTSQEQTRFLLNHSKDSKIDIFIYVFAAGQQIPGEVREEELIERLYSTGKPAVVVNYYLGKPLRATVSVSPAISDSVSAVNQQKSLRHSVDSAFQRMNEREQLAEFCVQLSIRAYWMERSLGLTQDEVPALPVKLKTGADEKAAKAAKKAMLLSWARELALPVGLGVGGSLLLILIIAILRSRRQYRFPEFDVPARLGGSYAAGIGPTVSFRRGSSSPAVQRGEAPDYLNRI
jgi:hypothetical protein